jgi:two-component system chemotaxis response regulator CheY
MHRKIVPNSDATDEHTEHVTGPHRVLVADADADTRTLYELALPLAGCEVVQAGDGRDALTKALTETPTLIITELRLPLIGGIALCEIIRRDAATRSVPILVVTSETRPTELDRIRNAGASAVLVKPTLPDALVNEVRHLLTHPTNGASKPATAATPSNGPKNSNQIALAKTYARFRTTSPPARPPALTCPSCDDSLEYDHSYAGGVSSLHAEQWDYYTCSTCGRFQYRQRTRKLHGVR